MKDKFVNVVEGGMGTIFRDGKIDGLYTTCFTSCFIHIIIHEKKITLIHDNCSSAIKEVREKIAKEGIIEKIYIVSLDKNSVGVQDDGNYPIFLQENFNRTEEIYEKTADFEKIFVMESFIAVDNKCNIHHDNSTLQLCTDPEKWSSQNQLRFAINRINSQLGNAPLDLVFDGKAYSECPKFILQKDQIRTLLKEDQYHSGLFEYILEAYGEKDKFLD